MRVRSRDPLDRKLNWSRRQVVPGVPLLKGSCKRTDPFVSPVNGSAAAARLVVTRRMQLGPGANRSLRRESSGHVLLAGPGVLTDFDTGTPGAGRTSPTSSGLSSQSGCVQFRPTAHIRVHATPR